MDFSQQLPIVIHSLNVGFLQTLKLFAITLVGACPLGLAICFGSMSRIKPVSAFFKLLIWVVRGTPLMIQLLIIYFFPGLVLHNPIWGGGETGRFLAASVSFILNYACYFSEIYRGGIQSVPVGQEEAGLVLGMTKSQIFFRVKLLQMVKRIIPPMSNEIDVYKRQAKVLINVDFPTFGIPTTMARTGRFLIPRRRSRSIFSLHASRMTF